MKPCVFSVKQGCLYGDGIKKFTGRCTYGVVSYSGGALLWQGVRALDNMQMFRIYVIKVMACLPGGQVLLQILKHGDSVLNCMPIELRSC